MQGMTTGPNPGILTGKPKGFADSWTWVVRRGLKDGPRLSSLATTRAKPPSAQMEKPKRKQVEGERAGMWLGTQ